MLTQGREVPTGLPGRCRWQHRDDRATEDNSQGRQYAAPHHIRDAGYRKDDERPVSGAAVVRGFLQGGGVGAQRQ